MPFYHASEKKSSEIFSGSGAFSSSTYYVIKCPFKPSMFSAIFYGVTNKSYECVAFATRDGNGRVGQQQMDGNANGYGKYSAEFGDDYVKITLPNVGNNYLSKSFNYYIA